MGARLEARGVTSAGSSADLPTSRRFDDVEAEIDLDRTEKEHLAGAGNWLYKVEVDGRSMVLKIYEGTRSRFLYWKKTFGNVVLTGRSSHCCLSSAINLLVCSLQATVMIQSF